MVAGRKFCGHGSGLGHRVTSDPKAVRFPLSCVAAARLCPWRARPVEIEPGFGLNGPMRWAAWCVALVCTSSAIAAQPVLHEFFQLDGDTQLPPVAGAPKANFPLAAQAPTRLPEDPFVAAAAVPEAPDLANERPQQPSADDEYRLDGNTSKPSQVGYSDPFTPSIPPFKRLHAYDSVNSALELVVAKSALKGVHVGGVARPSQDQFMGKQTLRLEAGQLVRLPTVGPGVRVINGRLAPQSSFQLFQDSAENLFIQSANGGEFEWVVHLAIERGAFGSAFADVSWTALAGYLPSLPQIVNTAAEPVLERLKLSNSVRPAAAVRRMVEYFRSFEPKDELRQEKGLQLYREIALSQKGVCRHRAFAFVVTGLALGLPTRFVRNEAHAWVEVFDSRLWHRLDLGGAAGEMALTSDLDVPHEVPPDPYKWPAKSESGESMVDRALQAAMARAGGDGSSGGGGAFGSAGRQGGGANAAQPGGPVQTPGDLASGDDSVAMPAASSPSPASETSAPDEARVEPVPETTLTVAFTGASLKRGERFSVQGTARNGKGQTCSLLRIDVELFEAGTKATFSAGTLVTDEQGRYAGQLVLPQRVPVGDYRVRVTTPGHQSCASSQ